MAATVMTCSLVWMASDIGWRWLGLVAAGIALSLVACGYAWDLECSLRKSQLKAELRSVKRSNARMAVELAKKRVEAIEQDALVDALQRRIEFWTRVAYGVEPRPPEDDETQLLDEQFELPVLIGVAERRN